jgi:hypothetical protein
MQGILDPNSIFASADRLPKLRPSFVPHWMREAHQLVRHFAPFRFRFRFSASFLPCGTKTAISGILPDAEALRC